MNTRCSSPLIKYAFVLLTTGCFCLSAPFARTAAAATISGSVVGDVSMVEGDAGTQIYNFTVRLTVSDGPTVNSTSITWGTQNASATTGTDYVSNGGTIPYGPGLANGDYDTVVAVTVNGDTDFEGDEVFRVRVTDVLKFFPGDTGPAPTGFKTGTILNDDPEPPTEIHGIKFGDVNTNGVYDVGTDTLLSGVNIGLSGTATSNVVTGVDGQYHFTNIVAGTYTVTETVPFGSVATTSASVGPLVVAVGDVLVAVTGQVALGAGQTEVVNAGLYFGNITAPDFGDAPDPAYPTLLASDGARHTASPLFLGGSIDVELDGQPNADATGDGADEDGVTFTEPLVIGEPSEVDVVVTGAGGLLNAWIDFNGDGDWEDAGEQIFTDEAVAAGSNVLSYAVPATATRLATTFARFRLDTAGGLGVTGSAADGEVEDYEVEIQAKGSLYGFKYEDVNGNGVYDDGIDEPFENIEFVLNGTDVFGDSVNLSGIFTDSNGVFSVTGVIPGGYTVDEVLLAGTVASTPETFGPFTIGSGQVYVYEDGAANLTDPNQFETLETGLIFGNYIPGSIHGYKFEDVNGNGAPDMGIDVRRQGVLITLTGTDGMGNPVDTNMFTDVDGEFWFVDLVPGNYTVTETMDPGWAASTPISFSTSLGSGEELVAYVGQAMLLPADLQHEVNVGASLIFGNYVPGAIHGFKFEDVNGNGVQDYFQDFDSVAEPALPAGWVSDSLVSNIVWLTSTNLAETLPNAACLTNHFDISDTALESPEVVINSLTPRVSFRHWYETDGGFDGGVLEISIDGGPWTDIIVAGGSFAAGGYDGPVGGENTPLEGRDAWTGSSFGFKMTMANLPPAAIGKPLKLRWRFGTGDDVDAAGWYIDSISLDEHPMAGLIITLDGVDGTGLPVVSNATTTAAGEFWFSDIVPGNYLVYEGKEPGDAPEGFIQTAPIPTLVFDATVESRDEFIVNPAHSMGGMVYGAPMNEVEVGADLIFGNWQPLDFGDAPNSYGTTILSNGARHVIADDSLYLGPLSPDDELDGQPGVDADGDDASADDDEDGVTFTDANHYLFIGRSQDIPVVASTNGFLDAWVDTDRDGVFEHPGEHISLGASLAVTTGVNMVEITVPQAAAEIGPSYARFRISSVGSLPPDGLADDGEVEDYPVFLKLNDAPIADDDSYNTPRSCELVVAAPGVLDGDTDGGDGPDPLTVLGVQTAPTGGVAIVNADGSFTYTPTPGFNGPDRFTYIVSDGLDEDIGEVTITIDNSAPVPGSQSLATDEEVPLPITLTAIDPDCDDEEGLVTISIDTHPANGTLLGTPPNVTYVPDPNFFGTDSFVIMADDGVLPCVVPGIITIEVAPVPQEVPCPISPANDEVLDGITWPDFVWQSLGPNAEYQIWIGDVAGTSPYYVAWLPPGTTFLDAATVEALDIPPGAYRWWVRGWDPSTKTYTAWCTLNGSFSVLAQVPGPTHLISPINDVEISDPTPTFEWSAVTNPDATWYRLWVNRNGTRIILKWVEGATTYTPAESVGAGNFEWWVRTWNEDGFGPWSDSASFLIPSLPGKVSLTSETPDGAGDTDYTFDSVDAATWYQIWINCDGVLFEQMWVETGLVFPAPQTFTFSGHTPGSTYRWWVRAWGKAVGYGPWSTPRSYTYPDLP